MKLSILAFFAFLFSTCQPAGDGMSVIPVDEFEKLLADTDAQLLDVRTPEEFEAGHIQGALLVDYRTDPEGFVQKVEAQLDKDVPVALYCRSGKRSHDAALLLQKAGYKQLIELQGGILAWQEAGKDIEVKKTAQ